MIDFKPRLPENRKLRAGQVAVWIGLAITLVVLWFSNSYLTNRFTEAQRALSADRASLYANAVSSTLQRAAYVPLLLSRDQSLISALQSNDYSTITSRLITLRDDLAAASISLIDLDGRIVATSDRRNIGSQSEKLRYFVEALRSPETVFTAIQKDGRVDGFYYARKITAGNQTLGVIVVEMDLQRQELIWRRSGTEVVLYDSSGQILLASKTDWRRMTLDALLSSATGPTTSEKLLGIGNGEKGQAFVYIDGKRLLVSEAKIGFLGWRLSYFASLENVQARVNAVIALELMGLSLLAALAFYVISRRTARLSQEIRQESEELRRLNTRLSAEIEQRQRAEKDLETAEQSLEQASKLAALGQMSAAVSHELNQPLAAMRTYLAGARLLVQRKRPEEALSSFQRIDDLIERMGAITRQLKSHARKSEQNQKIIDIRECVDAALGMMAPQLGKTRVSILKTLPDVAVPVRADPVRVEQIIVNLLRNALDAVKNVEDKKIIMALKTDGKVNLSIQDNGTGIHDVEGLFEPFSTTKKPGDGVGLGLAISAGFASEMGGRLTGRNATPIGAIFNLELPRA